MSQIPDYAKNGDADNARLFHGREIRQVPDAAGGMGFVLQLSRASTGSKCPCQLWQGAHRAAVAPPAPPQSAPGARPVALGGACFRGRSQPTESPASASGASARRRCQSSQDHCRYPPRHAGEDPEGWSAQERSTYDGWGHDQGRTWRKADVYESEGWVNFKETYGDKAFGLNHRCYWHLDSQSKLWLSAEDGCEGVSPPRQKVLGLF